MKKFLSIVLFCAFSTVTLFSQNVTENYWDGVVYFKLNNNIEFKIPTYIKGETDIKVLQDFPELQEIVKNYDVTELKNPFRIQDPKIIRTYRIKFDNHQGVNDLLKDFYRLNYIEYVEQSPMYKTMVMPNDEFVAEQYYLDNIQAYDAWDIAENNYRPTVAIVDDAMQLDHPDLAANIWINPNESENGNDDDENGYVDDIHGYDVADDDNNPRPPDSPGWLGESMWTHGTHCSGLAGAVTNNDIGIAGVSNNNVSIIGVKVNSNDAFMPIFMENGPEGVDYAVSAGADIISMSFGGAQEMETLINIIEAGHNRGCIFVAAAGNDGNETVNYPAGYEHVIAVGASDADDLVAEFSQRGDFIDIMTPGAAIFSTLAWTEQYGPQDGTSMACPLTAGAIALLKAHRPDATNEQIISCLYAGADDISSLNPGLDGKIGAGRLNVYNSIMCLNDPVTFMEEKAESFKVFPNPANDFLNIEFDSNNSRIISLTNITGQNVLEIASDDSNIKLNLDKLNSGIYILVINEGNQVLTKKIVVQ